MALLTISLASRKVSGRRKLSDMDIRVWKLMSDISPILGMPVFVPQPTRLAIKAALSGDCLAERPRRCVNASMNRHCRSAKRRTLLISVCGNWSKKGWFVSSSSPGYSRVQRPFSLSLKWVFSPGGDAPVALENPRLEPLPQLRQVLADRLAQDI